MGVEGSGCPSNASGCRGGAAWEKVGVRAYRLSQFGDGKRRGKCSLVSSFQGKEMVTRDSCLVASLLDGCVFPAVFPALLGRGLFSGCEEKSLLWFSPFSSWVSTLLQLSCVPSSKESHRQFLQKLNAFVPALDGWLWQSLCLCFRALSATLMAPEHLITLVSESSQATL